MLQEPIVSRFSEQLSFVPDLWSFCKFQRTSPYLQERVIYFPSWWSWILTRIWQNSLLVCTWHKTEFPALTISKYNNEIFCNYVNFQQELNRSQFTHHFYFFTHFCYHVLIKFSVIYESLWVYINSVIIVFTTVDELIQHLVTILQPLRYCKSIRTIHTTLKPNDEYLRLVYFKNTIFIVVPLN